MRRQYGQCVYEYLMGNGPERDVAEDLLPIADQTDRTLDNLRFQVVGQWGIFAVFKFVERRERQFQACNDRGKIVDSCNANARAVAADRSTADKAKSLSISDNACSIKDAAFRVRTRRTPRKREAPPLASSSGA